MRLTTDLADRLRAAGLDPSGVAELAAAALAEDLGSGVGDGRALGIDVTSEATIPVDQRATGDVVARAAGVVAGVPVVEAVLQVAAGLPPHDPLSATRRSDRRVAQGSGQSAWGVGVGAGAGTGDGSLEVEVHRPDGSEVAPGDVVLTVTGPTRTLLLAERTALNLLCHASGVATLTRRWVDAVGGTGAAVRDSRKTLPLLRALDKHAVRCGGGVNHRMGLGDAALVKDNHVAAAGGVAAAFRLVRARFPDVPVEIEVDDLAGAVEAVEAGADLVLLDNFSVPELRAAVAAVAGRARLEASGGLTLDRAREVAETGVDYLAVGALTHSAPALDLGFDLRPVHPGAA